LPTRKPDAHPKMNKVLMVFMVFMVFT